jgi:Kef-type K+ transport system membrane component KefB
MVYCGSLDGSCIPCQSHINPIALFFLGGLATTAHSEAVLPAYLIGLVLAGVFMKDKTLVNRMRSIAFAMFTPFYFIKAGLYISLPALWASLGIVVILLVIKIGTKLIGVWPSSRMFMMRSKEASYTTLLMATGLTFGSISALFGLNNKIINQNQYTVLVTVVILSAIIPTVIAQKFFEPKESTMEAWGRLVRRSKNTEL